MDLENTTYCSLDIETSDFDPAVGEVLEVGFVLFKIADSKIKIIQEWESTFKPVKEVPARILALTGITSDELENSVPFSEKSREIQELVEECVIVGHNISFDIKFLEAFGIKFSGKKIDTLDLAQIFLPTYSSYNLEALMNLFGVDHKDAHRALADSKASLVVLERLLGIFSSFPEILKKNIYKLFEKNDSTFTNLLKQELPEFTLKLNSDHLEIVESAEIIDVLQNSRGIITFPLGYDYQNYVYGSLSKLGGKNLLVVNNKRNLYKLWKQGLVYPLFENKDLFNNRRFEKLCSAEPSADMAVFLAKILVWKHVNWQSEVLLDLNFSFFGNQYRNLISYDNLKRGIWSESKKEKTVALDYASFINYDWQRKYSDRRTVILDINSFESALTYVASRKISWSDYIYSLKQIYDPSTGIGQSDFSATISQALSEVDLFFGLISLNLRKINQEFSNILLDKNAIETEFYELIENLSSVFVEKMDRYNKELKSERINKLNSELLDFFRIQENQVKWVEILENRLTLHSSPLDLAKLAREKLGNQENIIFTASLGSDALINYFIDRLDLKNFEIKHIGQQELRKKIEVYICPEIGLDTDKILSLINENPYPLAVTMPNLNGIKDFYETNFKELQKKFKVFAQGFSGSTTKMLENFSINENSLFMATDKFVIKQHDKKLTVKALIITRLPFDQFTHPLFAAQAEKYQNKFVEFNIPRALYNFHSLIRFFYGHDLEKIYIVDSKIKKEYGKFFLDYLGSLPFVDIKY